MYPKKCSAGLLGSAPPTGGAPYQPPLLFLLQSPQGDVPAPEVQGHPVRKEECFLLSERINESLKLSQALHGTRNLEGLSSEHWRAWATRHLQQGGSSQAETDLVSTAGKKCSTPGRAWVQDREGERQKAVTTQHSVRAEGLTQPAGANPESVPSSLPDADSQKVTSNEPAAEKAPLPADSPSKDNEISSPKSPPPGESSPSRAEAGQAPSLHSLRVPEEQGPSLFASQHQENISRRRKRCHPNERHAFWGVNPGWEHFSEADAEEVKPCEGKGLLQHAVSPSWAHHAATIRVDLEVAWASPGSPALRTAVSRL